MRASLSLNAAAATTEPLRASAARGSTGATSDRRRSLRAAAQTMAPPAVRLQRSEDSSINTPERSSPNSDRPSMDPHPSERSKAPLPTFSPPGHESGTHSQVAVSQVPALRSGGFAPDVAPAQDGEEEYLGGDGSTSSTPDASRKPATPPSSASATASADTTISTRTVHGPRWSPHGSFRWDENYTTTGRNGWIVQEIVNTFDATQVTPAPGIPAGSKLIPGFMNWHYFEAWAVDGSGNVTPGGVNGNDTWAKAALGPGTKGTWTMAGYAYFTQTDPATHGLTPGGAPNAGPLLSGQTAPPGLGFMLWERRADGTWDSTGATPTHAGKAGGLTP